VRSTATSVEKKGQILISGAAHRNISLLRRFVDRLLRDFPHPLTELALYQQLFIFALPFILSILVSISTLPAIAHTQLL